MKYRWLSVVGILLLIFAFVAPLTSFATPYTDFTLPFLAVGSIGSFIVIGLGEILYQIYKKGDK